MISWFEKHRGVCWLFTILIGVVIFYVSSLVFEPGVGVGTSINALFYHLMAFFFFGFFLLMSLVGGKKRRLFVLGIVLAVVYGISDELHQFFVPGRHMSLFDIFLDTTGIVFAAMIYFIWVERRGSRVWEVGA